MNSYPIVIVCGKAGSGKDTAAGFIADQFKGQVLALADPLKRIAFKVFGISLEQLWGPSDERNKPAPNITKDSSWVILDRAYMDIQDIVGAELGWLLTKEQLQLAHEAFKTWAEKVADKLEDEGFLTPRYILQTMGTEWGRDKVDPDLWIKIGIHHAEKLLVGGYIYNAGTGLLTHRKEPVSKDMVIISDGRFRNEILAVRRLGGLAIKLVRPDDQKLIEKAGVAGHRSEAEMDGIPDHFFNAIIHNDDTLENLRQKISAFLSWQFEHDTL